jgi:sugar phosphate isomerase/epimerase
MGSVRIAFSSLGCPGWTVEQIVDAAGRFGFTGIEWRLADGELLGPRTDDAIWERIASSRIGPVCLDTSASFVQPTDEGRDKAVRHSMRMAMRAEQIGAPFVRVFAGAIPDGQSRDDLVEPTRIALGEAASSLPSSVGILVETHDAWCRGAEIRALTENIERVGVLWDVAHTLRAPEPPATTLAQIGVPGLVHLKDAIGDRLTLLGDGDLPLTGALDALVHHTYDGFVTFEWEKLWHPYLEEPETALPHAAAFLRRRLDM